MDVVLEEDLARLRSPYALDADDDHPGDGEFARALGLDLERVADLQRAVGDDLDHELGGIGWWAAHLGTRQRILIADYLHQVIGSITTNLIDARLHQLEGREAEQSAMDRHANDLTRVGYEVIPNIQPPTCGLDELPRHLANVHQAGFFRAIGSAVDCLGAAVVGVAGLSTNILRADMRTALETAAKEDEPSALAAETHLLLCDARDASGLSGWLSWATDYRNMLVHRARRLSLRMYTPRESLLGPTGTPILRVNTVEQLARDPGRSDIEALLAMAWPPAKNGDEPIAPVLEETATTTINGIHRSTYDFVNHVTTELQTMWKRRRADPQLVLQPAKQWPEIPSTSPTRFAGYRRGEVPFKADTLAVNPILGRRLQAAQLLGDIAATWNELD